LPSLFFSLDGIASIYAGPQGFMLELGGDKEIARVTADENGNIGSLCLQEITFWIATTAVAATSARRRNRSQ